VTLAPFGTSALRIDGIPAESSSSSVHRALASLAGVVDVVVADGSALVVFAADVTPFDPRPALRLLNASRDAAPVLHVIDVRYDGADLSDVARATGLSEEEVVERHAAPTYTVELVGFAPGFAYLGPLDRTLSLDRRPQPRPRVPTGAVGIALGRTAIYPHATPGGWHLLGHAPDARAFSADTGARFALGDRVRFQRLR